MGAVRPKPGAGTGTGTGLPVPRVVLGTMTFGEAVDEHTADAIVGSALDRGVTWIDTANSYGDGASEEILGRLLPHRDGVTVCTKVGQPQSAVGTAHLLSHAKMIRAVHDSLRRLHRDRIDILYLHKPDRSTPVEETLTAVRELIDDGSVRAFGVSNHAAWQVAEMVVLCERASMQTPVIGEQLYNVIATRLDDEYAEFAAVHGVPTAVYNPLAGGLLTGRYGPGRPPGPGRFSGAANSAEYRARYWDDRMLAAVAELSAIAEAAAMPVAELSLRWLAARPVVDSVIVGGSDLSHMEMNIDALHRPPLGREITAQVDAVSARVRGPMPRYNR